MPERTEIDAFGAAAGPPPISIPPACYTDPAVVAAEVQRLFRGGWIGVGRADMVADPGDFIALDIAGQAILLLRDRTGRLRAFANTCRHRGARLMDGAGTCRGIRCPFHAWAYRLDGSLAAAPQMAEVPGFDRADHGLIPYRAAERLGFAFVCLDPQAPPLDDTLGDFAAIHAPWPLENLVSTRRREMTVECNWKAFLDVFNEYYHLPFVHAASIDQVYAAPDAADAAKGGYASQFGPTEGTGGLLQTQQQHAVPVMPGLTGHAATGVRYSWVFPNMTFAAGTDALWVYEAYPLEPGSCHVIQTACFPPETLALSGADARIAAYYARLDAALDEDIPALANQQRGLACPDARPGPLHPHLEANVAAFACWYAGRMADAFPSPSSQGPCP